MSERVGIIAYRKDNGEFEPARQFTKSTAIALDRLTTPLTKAYERYLQACKERGREPD